MKSILAFVLLVSGVAFAGIYDACHTENHDSLTTAQARLGM